MEELQEKTLSTIERKIGYSITYQGIRPSFLLRLEVSDITLTDSTSRQDIPLLKLQRIEISYNLLQLIQGNLESAIKAVSIINSHLSIDTKRDKNLFQLLFPPENARKDQENPAPSIRLPRMPGFTISGKNLSITVTDGERKLQLSRIFFTLRGSNEVNFDLQGELLATGDDLHLSTSINSSGLWQAGSSGNIRFAFRDFTSPWVSVSRIGLAVRIEDDTILVRKLADRIPLDIEGSYNLEEGSSSLSLIMEDFQPSRYLSLEHAAWQPYAGWLDNRYSGTGSIYLASMEHADQLRYQGDLRSRIDHTPGLDLPFPAGHDVSVLFDGDLKNVNIHAFRVTSSDMDLEGTLKGSVDPLSFGTEMTIHRYGLGEHSLAARLSGEYRDNSLRLRSSGASWGAINLTGADLLLDGLDGTSYAFNLNMLFPDEENGAAALYADGEIGTGDELFMESTVLLDGVPLLPFLDEADLPDDFQRELYTDASFFFSTDGKRLSYSAGYVVLRDREEKEYLKVSGSGNLANHNLQDIEARYGDYRAGGDASIAIREGQIALKTDFQVNGIEYGFSAYHDRKETILLTGDHASRGLVRFSREGLAVDASVERFPLPLPGQEEEAFLSFQLHGTYRNLQEWKVLISSMELSDLSIPLYKSLATLELEALATPDRIRINRMTIDDSISNLTGRSDIDMAPPDLSHAKGWINLKAPRGEELYRAIFQYENGIMDASAHLKAAPLQRAGIADLSGSVDGSLLVSGAVEDPDLSVDISLSDGTLGEAPLELETSLLKREGLFSLEYGRFRYDSHLFQKMKGTYTMKEGDFALSGDYQPEKNEILTSAGFSINGKTAPIAVLSELPEILRNDFQADLLFYPIITPGTEKDAQRFSLYRQQDQFRLAGGTRNSVAASLSTDGSFQVQLSEPSPYIGTLEGTLQDKRIEATAQIQSLDLSPLEGLVDLGFFALQGGTAEGTITIRGDLQDPSFFGSLSVTETEATSILFQQGLEPFDAIINLDDKSAVLVTEPIQTSQSSLDVTGELLFERWLPESFSIHIMPNRQNGVPITYAIPGGGVNVTGLVKGLFIVKGNRNTIELFGDLVVSDASVTLQNQDAQENENTETRKNEQIPFDIMVGISIETGRRVEFFWPTTSFPILRSFAAPEQQLSIAYDSSSGTFSLEGDIGIQGGEVSYLQRNFLLSRGRISFNEDENRFDPRLSFEALLRDMDTEGEPVRIYLNVADQPLSQFSPRFSSEPSMSDAEIIAVLGAALPSRIGQEALDITAGLALTGSMVSQLGILNSFESRVKDVLNLDLFSIRTYMIQNLIMDRVGSVITNEAVQGGAFSRYLDNTSIFLGKYFGNDLFIQGTLQIQANDAFSEESVHEDELFIDSEISIEWDTPLFMLEFAVRPDFINPLNTVNNASLGLSWGFSY